MQRSTRLITLLAITTLASAGLADKQEVKATKLKKRDAIKCGDVDTLVIDHAYIVAKGKTPAIHLLDSCTVVLKNSFIEADQVAIDVYGTGTITIENSKVYGGTIGIRLLGTSTATITKSHVAGKKQSVAAKATSTVAAKDSAFYGKKKVTRFATWSGKKNKFVKRLKKRFKAPVTD